MKKQNLFLMLIWGLFLIASITSCKKDSIVNLIPTPASQLPPDPAPSVRPENEEIITLTASAGSDLLLELPVNSIALAGSSNFGKNYSWRKIAGPSSYQIDSEQAQKINITNLESGLYKFELTVTSTNKIAKDTVAIDVFNQFIFRDVQWVVDEYPFLKVYNINSYLPANSAVKKLFIQRDFESTWIEITNSEEEYYNYGIENNNLFVYLLGHDITDDASDRPNLKILY